VRRAILALGALALPAPAAAAAAAAPRSLGAWGAWGAFRDAERCWAVALPQASRGHAPWRAYAGIGSHPAFRQRAAFFVRLSRARDRSVPVVLSVGGRRFRLAANGTDAWAPDAAADRTLVAALRGARAMSVSAAAPGGRPFADVYRLDGAATAVDAARLACLGGER